MPRHVTIGLGEPDLTTHHDLAEVVLVRLAGLPLAGDALGEHLAGSVVTQTNESGEAGVHGEAEVQIVHVAILARLAQALDAVLPVTAERQCCQLASTFSNCPIAKCCPKL